MNAPPVPDTQKDFEKLMEEIFGDDYIPPCTYPVNNVANYPYTNEVPNTVVNASSSTSSSDEQPVIGTLQLSSSLDEPKPKNDVDAGNTGDGLEKKEEVEVEEEFVSIKKSLYDALQSLQKQQKQQQASTTSKGKYPCPFEGCGRTFTRRYNLNQHIPTHDPNREKPFVCNVCSRAFVRPYELKRHCTRLHPTEGLKDIPQQQTVKVC